MKILVLLQLVYNLIGLIIRAMQTGTNPTQAEVQQVMDHAKEAEETWQENLKNG